MIFYDNPRQPDDESAFGVPKSPTVPTTLEEKYEEMMRRRACFRQMIAEYDASREEPEEQSCAMW
ncbi:hypothetical protein [Cupriavidus plantarum]|uniref:hypothetical protein n=1 Tax=Cupriavidus plantarum TaxID=942865 RepID=UPI000EB4D168|nr:hypothetical protein [Cupriavidus plantarum]RLK36177.1 hypothetical protein C7417_3954 [Cupriavidus plantarum]